MNLSNCSLTPENDYFQNRSFCLRTSSASSLYVGYIRIKLRRHGVERFSRYEYSKSLVTKHMRDVTPSHNAQNTIKPEKCWFSKKEIKFLGLIISEDSITMDKGKVDAIKNWPEPKNKKELQQFLGFVNFY